MANLIVGNNGPNTLTGTIDTDIILGAGGDDDLSGKGNDDFLNGGSGNDRLDGGAGSDILRGGTGNDVLTGGLGDDFLVGGKDADRLAGGFGQNIFQFNTGDSLVGSSDTILDFGKSANNLLSLDIAAFTNGVANFTQEVHGNHSVVSWPDPIGQTEQFTMAN